MTGPIFASSFLSTEFPTPKRTKPAHDEAAIKTTFPEYFPDCKFVFPTGAARKTTVFGGRETHAWFDISDFSDRTKGEPEMIDGLRESSIYLSLLIKKEIELLYESRAENGHEGKVCLVGFSQGSAMGSMLLLGAELERLGVSYGFGGFVGLSGWLPFRRQIEEAIVGGLEDESMAEGVAARRRNAMLYVRRLLGLDAMGRDWDADSKALHVPVFLGHGELDRKVNLEWGLQLRDVLQKLGVEVSFKSYPGLAHGWIEEEMMEAMEFLKNKWY